MSNTGDRGTVARVPAPASLEALVADCIRLELARQGRSRRWLAEAVGVPHVTVARWVAGRTSPGLNELDAMCRALGTTVGRMLVELQRRGQGGPPLARPA